MIVETGEKVHVIERRQFAEDLRRHFVGQVTRCTESAIRVRGHAWVHDHVKGDYIRKPDKRERVMHPERPIPKTRAERNLLSEYSRP
jgi:hypothetical protein